MATQATLLDRIRMLENRVNYLERGLLTGTTGVYKRSCVFTKSGISDNVATSIFTITTTNESGSTDGGGYSVHVESLIGHAIANNATDLAIEWNDCVFQRVNKADGTATSALGEIVEGAPTASAGATRSIGAVTPAVVDTSNTVLTFTLQIDLTGTDVTTAQAVCRVEFMWWGYLTPPILAAA